jgi:hypothetical protein
MCRLFANYAPLQFAGAQGVSQYLQLSNLPYARGFAHTPIACKEHARWGFGVNYIAQQIVPRGGETIFAAAIIISAIH